MNTVEPQTELRVRDVPEDAYSICHDGDLGWIDDFIPAGVKKYILGIRLGVAP